MKRFNIYAIFATIILLAGCTPAALKEEELFVDESQVTQLTADGKIYHLEEFLDEFMTEDGNYKSDSILYRTRATNDRKIYMFSIDTLPTNGPGIYIMGRVTTDDYAGNFYKTLVIQEIVDGKQQNLRLSVDMGSAGGFYHIGQMILVRCNGLAIGRYANQPQLCVPTYNNNIYAQNAAQKVGWAPGRIPTEMFRLATTVIGVPQPEKLMYEDLTVEQLFNKYISNYDSAKDSIAIATARKVDGLLVRINNTHFTGTYDSLGNERNLRIYNFNDTSMIGNPERDQYANVFAPTTKNVGYPQSRIIADVSGTYKTQISTSEFAKYARYYIPSKINEDFTKFDYAAYSGQMIGILSNYRDNAGYEPDKWDWSVNPRSLDDIILEDQEGNAWEPVEFSVNNVKRNGSEESEK